MSVTFSPDGSQIVSGSSDNTIRIWDAAARPLAGKSLQTSKPLSFRRVSHHLPLHCYLLDDGWVVDQYNYRLIWVPQHLHEFLPTPGLLDIIGTRRMVVIDASDVQTGTEWSSCVDTS
ncbi:hypothetical protein DL96DRAFT_1596151 [Flagelloscypha sp. PMI_526]|nr:hypothetical protein DL96DRAFT_1596151 [Flagelloscypha sp. PMI_526]